MTGNWELVGKEWEGQAGTSLGGWPGGRSEPERTGPVDDERRTGTRQACRLAGGRNEAGERREDRESEASETAGYRLQTAAAWRPGQARSPRKRWAGLSTMTMSACRYTSVGTCGTVPTSQQPVHRSYRSAVPYTVRLRRVLLGIHLGACARHVQHERSADPHDVDNYLHYG